MTALLSQRMRRGLIAIGLCALVAVLSAPAMAHAAEYPQPVPGDTYLLTRQFAAVPLAGYDMSIDGIAFDADGFIWTVENPRRNLSLGTSRLVKRSASGLPLAIYGQGSGPEHLFYAAGIAIDPVTGRIYVTDGYNCRVVIFDRETGQFLGSVGEYIQSTLSTITDEPYGFDEPSDIAFDTSGNFYVTDRWNNRVMKYDQAHQFVTAFGIVGGAQGGTEGFDEPLGIAIDIHGDVWVADSVNGRIQKYSPNGTYLDTLQPEGYFSSPTDVYVDTYDTVYVADQPNVAPWGQGRFSRWGAQKDSLGAYGEKPDETWLYRPTVIFVDTWGSVWIQDKIANDVAVQMGTWTLNAGEPDVTPPNTTSNAPTDWVQGPVNVQLSAVDASSPVIATYWSTGTAEPANVYSLNETITIADEGTTTVNYRSVDRHGNEEPLRVSTVRIDNTDPTSTCTALPLYYGTASISFTSTDTLSGVRDVWWYVNTGLPSNSPTALITQQGVHTLTYWSEDNAGNAEDIKTVTVTVAPPDSDPPITYWAESAAGDWFRSNPTVTLVATDTVSGVAYTAYRINSSEPVTFTTPFVWSQEGTHTLQYWSVDNIGQQETTRTEQIRLDRTKPSSIAHVPVGAIGSATVTFEATDAVSGVNLIQWRLDTDPNWTDGDTAYIPTPGNKTIWYRSIDRAGNAEDVRAAPITVLEPDYEPPVTDVNFPKTGWVAGPFNVQFLPQDAISGLLQTIYIIDDAPAVTIDHIDGPHEAAVPQSLVVTDGVHTIQWASIDVQGNREVTQTATLKVDSVAPTTTDDHATLYTGPATIRLTNSGGLAPVTTYYKLDGGLQQAGNTIYLSEYRNYTIEYWSEDDAGNKELPHKVINVSVNPPDVTPPVTTFASPSGWQKGTTYFDLVAVDESSTIDSTLWSTNGATFFPYLGRTTITQEGTTTISYYSVDFFNNREATKTASVMVDASPPITTSDAVTNYTERAVISLTPTDTYSGLNKTFYRVNGGSWVEGTSITVDWSRWRRTHTVEWYSTDMVGNSETIKSATFEIRLTSRLEQEDNPNILYRGSWDLASQQDIAKTNESGAFGYIAFQGTRLDLYAHRGQNFGIMRASIVGTSAAQQDVDLYRLGSETNDDLVWTTGDLDFGDYIVKVERTGLKHPDASSPTINIDQMRIEGSLIQVEDSAAPVTTDNAPLAWTQGPVTVTLTSTDATTGVQEIRAKASTTGAEPGPGDLYTAPITITDEGETTLKYLAIDGRGNREATKTATVKIDNSPPLSSVSPQDSYVGTATIGILSTDAYSKVGGTYWRVDAGEWASGTVATVPNVLGSHALQYYSIDNAGNRETTKTASLTTLRRYEETSTGAYYRGTWTQQTDGQFSANTLLRSNAPGAVAYFVFKGTRVDLITNKTSASGIAKITVDGGTPSFIDLYSLTAAAKFRTIIATGLSDTTHTVQVECTGTRNGAATDSYVSVDAVDVVGSVGGDSTPPTSECDADGEWRTTAATVTLTATDELLPVSQTRYRLGDSPSVNYTAPFEVAAEGSTRIEYASADLAGNWEATKTAWVRIDRVAPEVTHTSLTGWKASPVDVSVTATDAGSGVAQTYYSTDGSTPNTVCTGPITVSAEGTTTVRYRAVDALGHESVVGAATVLVDMTPPSTTDDASLEWETGPTSVTLTPTDLLSGPNGTRYRRNGSAAATYTAPVGFTTDGTHLIEYASVDAAGNWETTKTATVRIDSVAPVTTHNAPTGWVTGPVTVTLSPTDATSGFSATYYSLDGSFPTLPYAGPIQVTAAGDTHLRFYSVDAAGNAEGVKSTHILIDGDAPVTTATAPEGWQRQSVSVTLTAVDPVSGVIATMYRVNTGAWTPYSTPIPVSAEGTTVIQYRSTDLKGNVEQTKSTTVTIDTVAPSTTDDAPQEWVDGPVTVTLTPTDATSGYSATYYSLDGSAPSILYTGAFEVTDPGDTEVRYYSVDEAGNAEDAHSTHVLIDPDAPVTTDDALQGWLRQPVSVTLEATDAVSGVAATEFRTDGGLWTTYSEPIQVSKEGTTVIDYRSTDVKGNVEQDRTATLTVDTEAPVTASDIQTTYAGIAAITLTPTDAISGVAFTEYRLDGGDWVPGYMVNVVTGGPHTLEWRSTDVAGNTETIQSAAFRVVLHYEDDDARILYRGEWYDASNASLSGGKMRKTSFSGTTAYIRFRGPGMSWIALKAARYGIAEVRVDGGAPQDVDLYSAENAWQSAVWSVSGLSDTTHTVTIAWTGRKNADATDAEINIDALEVDGELLADNAPPTTSASATGAWRYNSETVSLNASDDGSYVARTRFSVNGSAATTYTVPFLVTLEGTNTIEYASIDGAGNVEETRTAFVRIDRTLPTVTHDAPSQWVKGPVPVTLTASDAGAGVWLLLYSTDGGSPALSYKNPFVISQEGTTTVKFKAIDAVQNASPITAASVRIDNTAPSSVAEVPAAWTSVPASVTLASSDALSGVSALSYKVGSGDWTPYTGTFTVPDEGIHTVFFRATDAAGNVEPTTTATVRVDLTAPVTSAHVAASYVGTSSVSLSATDAASGVGATEWRIDSGEWQSGSTATLPGITGQHTLQWRSTDAAGNVETANSATYLMYTRYEQNDPAILYKGEWFRVDNASLYGNSMAKTVFAGTSAHLSFVGTAIDWVALKSPRYGIARVRLDDEPAQDVDLYAESNEWKQSVWSASELDDTTHTVTIEWTGEKNPAATANELNIDAFEIAGSLATDVEPPVTTCDATGVWRASNDLVTLTASDSGYVAATRYRINSGVLTTYTVPFLVTGEGQNTIEYFSVDGAGNTEPTKTATVRIDRVLPLVSDTAPTSWVSTPHVDVTLDATDAASGVSGTMYSLDGSEPSVAYSGPVRISDEGTTILRYVTTDVAGNASILHTATVRIDRTAPTATHAAPSQWVTSPVDVTLNGADELSGISAIQYQIDGGEEQPYNDPIRVAAEGTTTITFRAIDGAGNSSEATTAVLRVDTEAPATSDNISANWVSGPVSLALDSVDTASGIAAIYYSLDGTEPSIPFTGPVSVVGQGITTVKYRAVDLAGNEEAVVTDYVKIDDGAPTTTDNVPDSYVDSAMELVLTADDDHSGVFGTYYRLNGGEWTSYSAPVALSTEGTTTIEYYSLDVKGNSEATQTAAFLLDHTAPSTTASVAASYYSTATVPLTAHDNASGIESTQWRVDQGEWQSGPTATLPLVPGRHTLEWRSTDNAGNVEEIASSAYDMFQRVEQNNPSVVYRGEWYRVDNDLLSGKSMTKTIFSGTSAHVSFRGTAIEWVALKSNRYGIARVRLDDRPAEDVDLFEAASAWQAKPWRASGLDDTTHTVTIEWTGNKNPSAIANELNIDGFDIAGTLITDVTPPVTTSSATGAWRSTNETVTLTGSDSSYVAATRYQVNSGALTTYTVPFAVTGEGTNTIRYFSIDGVGNVESTRTAIVRIDRTKPGAANDAPSAWVAAAEVPVTLTASDAASGVNAIYYSTDGSDPSVPYSTPLIVSSEGTSTIRYKAVDVAGNASNAQTATVRIDRTTPSAADNAPSGWVKSPPSVTLTASDTLSGISSIRYRIGDSGELTTYTAPVQVIGEGVKDLQYTARDAAGNEVTRSATVRLDLTSPITTASVAASYSAGATIALSAEDALSGVTSTEWRIDTGSWTVGTQAVLPATPGRHTLQWRSTDGAGNVEAARSATYDMYSRVEQTDARLYFKGEWFRIDNANLSGDSMNKVISPNSGAYVKFKGTAANLIALKSPRYGIVRVSVDGGAPTDVDLYDANSAWESAVWSVSGLSDTTHTVAIEWTGQKNQQATANEVNFDAIEVAGQVLDYVTDLEQSDTRLCYDQSWFDIENPNLTGGKMRKTISTGTASMTFRGTGAEWRALKAPRYGIAQVSVDGTATELVDLYDAGSVWDASVWSVSGLRDDTHTVSISWTGQKNASATANEVNIDSLKVRGLPVQHRARFEQDDPRIYRGNDWFRVNSFNLSGGSQAKVNEADSPAFVSFKGTEIRLIGLKTTSYGRMRITLDTTQTQTVDLYAPTDNWKSTVWSAEGLSDTTHTVMIEWTGDKNPASSSTAIGFDAVDIVGTLVTAVPTQQMYSRFAEDDSRISYLGSWAPVRSFNVLDGTLFKSTTPGDAAYVAFRGTAFKWIGLKAPSYGIARLTLDGGAPMMVDLYSPTDAWKAKLWSVSGLSDTTHTVTIEWTGQRNPLSKGDAVPVDGFDVLGTLVTATPSGTRLTRYEQTHAGLHYDGLWTNASSWFMSADGGRKANTAGAKMTVNFTGTEVSWIGLKSLAYGIAHVSIDGGEPQAVDLYAPTDQWKSLLFTATGLSDGPHTMSIEWTGQKNAASNGTAILVDAIDVRGTVQ